MTESLETNSKILISEVDTKKTIRKKVCDHLRINGLSFYPYYRRIPNFKGSDEAGDKIVNLPAFQNSKVVNVGPNRPLLQVRVKTLEAGKNLLIPAPRLLNNVLVKIDRPVLGDEKTLKSSVTRNGQLLTGKPVDIDHRENVDLIVVGCVAVSPKGHRIGKGGGLSDLEYSIMASLGMLDENVVVVTVVHDDQVMDLPENLFQLHDICIDIIVTPTRVIECNGGLKKPTGIIWNLISEDRLKMLPVLSRIRYRDWKSGKDVKLEGEEADPTELEDVLVKEEDYPQVKKPQKNNRRYTKKVYDSTGYEGKKEGQRRPKNVYRSNRTQRDSDPLGSDGVTDDEKKNDEPNGELRQGSIRNRKKYYDRKGGGSVYVGSLPRVLRVSQFKSQVRNRQVNPLKVLWRGHFAFLNFRTLEDAERALTALEGLSLCNRTVKLEMAKSAVNQKPKEKPPGNVEEKVE